MYPGTYFSARFFAPRYFPEVGAAGPMFNPAWASGINVILGRERS